ncbi:MAG: hypothetical protein KAH38_06930, partial [Candidatus Hydrogenedentes bacterium]|nr:hypothetical protein [Candidatus Hydrogenedentota bacterium]
MKKVYVFQTLIAVAVAITMTAAVAQHVPISDPVADCVVQTCDAGTLPPETCMAIPIPPDAGSDCFTTPGAACTGIWPTTPFAPMPTWDLLVYGDFDGTTFTLTGVDEATDPLEVILPATYDFCAWSDHLVCALTPFAGLADEIGAFAYLVQCANMDINGALDECRNIPVTNNGIPERYELAILEAVLNDPGHALNTVAIAAMQKNTDALCGLIVEALAAVEISSGPPPSYMDVRGLSYGSAPWLMPSLGGILAAEAAMDDPLSNIALGELLGLLEDLGLTLPAGGITSICDGVFETSQGGDISANGFTNREIYEWFIQVDLGMTPAQYAAYAMDPLAVPGA